MDDSGAIFSEAIRDFLAQPTKKKTASFIRNYLDGGQIVTSEEVQTSIIRLEKASSQRISSKLRPVFEAILDYDGVIGTLCALYKYLFYRLIPERCCNTDLAIGQADPMPSALVWGGLKAVLEVRDPRSCWQSIS